MALSAADKMQIMKKFRRSKEDTGSSEVQIALLTARIEKLTSHLTGNMHDFHTRYGLTRLVSQRRRLLRYLKKTEPQRYSKLVETLEVRG